MRQATDTKRILPDLKTVNDTDCNITGQTEKTNNAAYNLTAQRENTAFANYVEMTRNENSPVEADNSIETLDESSTMAIVPKSILLANSNSIQNDTRDSFEMKELVQNQHRTTYNEKE